MKQITKKEFISRITNGKSLFIGISPCCDEKELNAVKQRIKERHISSARSCVEFSNHHVVFSDDSNLYLSNTKVMEITCFEHDDILIVKEKFTTKYYGFPDEVTYKYLYYAIV